VASLVATNPNAPAGFVTFSGSAPGGKPERWHHIRYPILVTKTTVYLPDDLKLALARIASSRGRSEADLIREALRDLVRRSVVPRPIGALFASGDRSLSDHVEDALGGFGDH
jgi:hypothetical protein